MKPSPLPWTQGMAGKLQRHNANQIYDAGGNCVASIPNVSMHCSVEEVLQANHAWDRQGMANAAFIVRACNSHDGLQAVVMAADALLKLHDDAVFICGEDDEAKVCSAVRELRRALVNATTTTP